MLLYYPVQVVFMASQKQGFYSFLAFSANKNRNAVWRNQLNQTIHKSCYVGVIAYAGFGQPHGLAGVVA